MADHIPDPGQHRTLLYREYANRVRGERQWLMAAVRESPTEPFRRRCSPSWARLIAKIRRHGSVEFCRFLDAIEDNVPTDLDVHGIMDNHDERPRPLAAVPVGC